MKTEQLKWTKSAGWSFPTEPTLGGKASLVLIFGATALFKEGALVKEVKGMYPRAIICGCSTAGEIIGREVVDDAMVVTAVQFDETQVRQAHITLTAAGGSGAAGKQLGQELAAHPRLALVFLLSDGLKTNGTELLAGISSALPAGVSVTGGLAGDGARFTETFTLCDDVALRDGVVAIGFYGNRLKTGCSSFGGWDPFGPERRITKSRGNVLFELDGQSALSLYKKYLGDQARDLPGSGLLFPLSLRSELGDRESVVRTILSVDENEQSMTFAGDMPEGFLARLMKANFDRLIDGAGHAAAATSKEGGADRPQLALLISCVGRKLVLKQRVEEEVEAVSDALGAQALLTGFYSYGEISPFTSGGKCELHNQTMTVVTLAED